jgi:ATP/maltotriose-dependent transcriptional regulator MalT
LLQTAILGRLTGSLCNVVTGRDDGQEMLDKLDKANLFIDPLDNERRWYRYHPLFADLLRKQLGRTQPDIVPVLHRLASQWYEKNGLISEAVDHLLIVEDIEGAARVVEENALAFQARGEVDRALGPLERALDLAEPEGFVRIFIGEGAPMGALLGKAIARGIALDYAGRLFKALEGETKKLEEGRNRVPSSVPSVADPSVYMVEPLTERECQVLRLLSAGLSNQEIAQELFLSINTIKTHTRNIYGKLNVRNRTHAVNRAKELGIL